MPFWRRRRPLHEELAEGTDLLLWEPRHQPAIGFGAAGTLDVLHGGRPRRWDAVVSAEAPLLTGDAVHFVALADGTLIVEEPVGRGALDPVVEALEQAIQPPYRAETVRRDRLWAAAASRIEVLDLPEHLHGDHIELAERDGERHYAVDGVPSLEASPLLEAYARERHRDFVARAERIDGTLWEVRVTPL